MSADNWAACPKCQKEEADNPDTSDGEGYVEDPKLREDYEIAIHRGEFYIHYSAQCYSCDFKKSFHIEEKIDV